MGITDKLTQLTNIKKSASSKDTKYITEILDRRGISPNRTLLTVFTPVAGQWTVLTDDGVLVTRKLLPEQYFPYKSISSIKFKDPGLTGGLITFITTDGKSADVFFSKNEAEVLRKVHRVVEEKQSSSVPTSQVSSGTSKADELMKLAALKRDGAISEEEYVQLKKDLLSNH